MRSIASYLFALLAALSARAGAAEAVLATMPDGTAVTGDDVVAEAQRAPAELRAQALSELGYVGRMAQNVLTRRALARAAERDGLDKDPAIAARLRLAREQVLAEAQVAKSDAQTPSRDALERLAHSEYLANPKKFETPEQVRVQHILIDARSCDAEKRIDELLARARAGENFATLAKENSQDPGSAEGGGDLGFFARGKMAPEFEAAAFALKSPGDLSGVVRTEFGLHIIRLEERKPAKVPPFDEVKDALIRDLAARDARDRRTSLVAPIEGSIRVDEAAVKQFAAQKH